VQIGEAGFALSVIDNSPLHDSTVLPEIGVTTYTLSLFVGTPMPRRIKLFSE